MASQFFALIFAESFLDLVFAAYLALLGKRVAVVASRERLQGSADVLLMDPFRSRVVCDWLGLPLKSEKDPFVPDFQIITSGRRVELFYDRPRREFALERDLGPDWKKFSALVDRLVELGNQYQEQVKERQILNLRFGADVFSRVFSRVKPTFGDGSLGDLIREFGINNEERQIIMAPLKLVSPYFQETSPLFSAALLWRFLLATGEGSAGEEESWQGIFEILDANGSLVQEQPFALITSGKRLASLKLRTGRLIEADYFFAEPNRIFYLLDEEKRGEPPSQRLGGQILARNHFQPRLPHGFRVVARAHVPARALGPGVRKGAEGVPAHRAKNHPGHAPGMHQLRVAERGRIAAGSPGYF